MSTMTASLDAADEAYWWQGSLMRIKARGEDTGGAMGIVEACFPQDFGPPLHVHSREDEAFYVIEGEIRIRQGDEEFVAGSGAWVWGPRGEAHAFKVVSQGARALVVVTPGGFERMFEAGGTEAHDGEHPPDEGYDPDAARAISEQFGFEVVGPQLD